MSLSHPFLPPPRAQKRWRGHDNAPHNYSCESFAAGSGALPSRVRADDDTKTEGIIMNFTNRFRLTVMAFAAAAPMAFGAPVCDGRRPQDRDDLPGPITDNDWNSVGYNGLEAAAKALGADVAYSENVSDADAERVLRDYANRGYQLIFAHSFSFGDATLNVAEDFPDTTFMAGTARELARTSALFQSGLSGRLSRRHAGGRHLQEQDDRLGRRHAGAQHARQPARLRSWRQGRGAGRQGAAQLHRSWFDPPKTKEAAVAQVEQGADVLSAQGVGVIDAAISKNVYAIGAMTDQNHLGEKTVLTSVLWDIGPLVTAVGKEVEGKTWVSKNWSYGIAEGSVKLADFHGLDANVPPAVMKAVTDMFEAIKSGAFTVPLDTSNAD